MRILKIEWKHLDVAGETCNRCSDTGETVTQVIREMTNELQEQGVELEFIDTKLDEAQVAQSNEVLIDGVPLENILNIKVSENYCESCSSLVGKQTFCRTVEYEGVSFEEIPAEAIRAGIRQALGIEAPAEKTGVCSCGSGCCGQSMGSARRIRKLSRPSGKPLV